MNVLPLVLAAALAAVHLLAGRLKFVHYTPRSVWLSLAGGVSVAYVFVHLLPELQAHQRELEERTAGPGGFLEHHVYLVALVGMLAFYGLERYVRGSRGATDEQQPTGQPADRRRAPAAGPGVFWVHVGSFALYNALVGYLLVHRGEVEASPLSLVMFFVAMALHFLVNDFGLREHHRDAYDRAGRWTLSAAVVTGAIVGLLVRVEPIGLAVLFALLAGGVLLNVFKEELPEERESRFWAFALGAAGYAMLLLLAG